MRLTDPTKISIIGAGRIGGIIAKHFAALDHKVFIANSRGPDTLSRVAVETGAVPVTVQEAALLGDIVIVTIPQRKIEALPKTLFAETPENVIVIDTGNYYPVARDGHIPEIDSGLPDSQWVERQLGRQVVKALNNITFTSLGPRGLPAGSPGRIALPVAGDDPRAKKIAMELIDSMGFDPLDAGLLSESWRQQPGTPAYCRDLDLAALQTALSAAEKDQIPAYRALADEHARRYIAGEITVP